MQHFLILLLLLLSYTRMSEFVLRTLFKLDGFHDSDMIIGGHDAALASSYENLRTNLLQKYFPEMYDEWCGFFLFLSI